MSNIKNDDVQWFKDSINELYNAKDDKTKSSIITKIYSELIKLESVEKLPKPEKKKRGEKLPNITNYPATVEQIKTIVKEAYEDGNTIVRVAGSKHSVPDAIVEEVPNKKVVFISLEKFNGIEEFDKKKGIVRVKAGTHLNKDPQDSTSTLENSFNYLIDKEGFALPDLGGIGHQTIGGFISTGSSGGSIYYSLDDSIIGIDIIDGKGNEVKLEPPDNKFFAAGVSMGLFGIITHVTFQLEDKYNIYGNQVDAIVDKGLNPNFQLGCPIDLLGLGTPTVPNLYEFFTNGANYDAAYSRLLWWPQENVNRLTIWKANRTTIKDLNNFDKPISPYKEFPDIFGSQVPAQILANIAYVVLNILYLSRNEVAIEIAALILSLFNGVIQQSFQDIWYKGLPMDDNVSDTILPTTFTELWFEMKDAENVQKLMNILNNRDPQTVGNNSTELYATKSSKFWLSPSYGYNVIRIDFLYFLGNITPGPDVFFEKCCDLFKDVKYRCHWGKYIPDKYEDKMADLYPKYEEWKKIRNDMDPKKIFVTPYWNKILNL